MEAQQPVKSFLHDVVLPKVELMHVVTAVLGGLMLWNHQKGGNALCIVGLGGLALTSFLSAFAPYDPQDEVNFPARYFGNGHDSFSTTANTSFFLEILVPKLLCVSSAVVIAGVLFRLMFWKGGTTMLWDGVPLLAICLVALGLNQRINRRAIIVAALGGFMLFTPYENIIGQLYSDDPQLIEIMVYQEHHPNEPAALQAYQKRMRAYRNNH